MVKAFIKGGVWKNSEDEILKAAVMKYGKQQWARVASLLNRKSAKQCKARWHEWLDPSVKKVEWSRPEEEKLLHLAKLMPAQWKTIGPLVGRTATQCQEHYEQLLDEATGAAASNSGEARSAHATLHAGQIDAHPETKPARPDPIDMDEDEMEMLQEARARLANTQGKKAKRKARERLLQQAKRLADLQKRRELKQAGLLSGAARKTSSKRKNEIDLGVEIPFHKPAPAGFHDTSTEAHQTERIRQNRLKAVDYHKVNENQYRTRDREAAMAQKREEARLKALEMSNMQYVVAQVSQRNDPLNTSRKRGALDLPAPQVSDQELQQLSKLHREQVNTAAAAAAASNTGPTQALLGDYTDRPLPTPMRTPHHAQQQQTKLDLVRQATELRRLEQGQTPLLVATGAATDEDEDQYVVPDTLAKATPKVTRSSLGSQTPLRDELGLNPAADDSISVVTGFTHTTNLAELARHERRAAKRARLELVAALAALPAPQFEYELATPEDDNDEDGTTTAAGSEPDMADVEAAKQEERRVQAEKLYKARNTVLKRKDLPRPAGAIPQLQLDTTDAAHAMIQEEMLKLLQHDAYAYPVVVPAADGNKQSKRRRKQPPLQEVILEILNESALDHAKEMLQLETNQIVQNRIAQHNEAELIQATTKVSREGAAQSYYSEDDGCFVLNTDELKSLQSEFQTIREATMALRKRNDKIALKLDIKNGGYVKRAKALSEQILACFAQANNHDIEMSVFGRLQAMETEGASLRIDALQEELEELEQQEAKMQQEYGDLLLEKKRATITNGV